MPTFFKKVVSSLFILENICFLFLILFACESSARWPTFLPPSKEFLLTNNLIDSQSCPEGQGKMTSGAMIQIKNLCTTFCPDSWFFMTKSDERCHDIESFKFERYEIFYHREQNGSVRNTKITAFYPGFYLTFITPNEHWYCYERDKNTHSIICANDV